MLKLALSLGALVLSAAAAMAGGTVLNPDQIKWGEAPPMLPKGAQAAVIFGDPTKSGPYVLRLRMPPNYQVPAHSHPTPEVVTVISGSMHIGMGDKLDTGKGQEVRAGGLAEVPAKMNHYVWTTGDTVIQVHGEGPVAITYVDPADDPSNKK